MVAHMQSLKDVNPLSANPTKWSNTLKQFAGSLSTHCLTVFDHFVKLALKGLKQGLNKANEIRLRLKSDSGAIT